MTRFVRNYSVFVFFLVSACRTGWLTVITPRPAWNVSAPPRPVGGCSSRVVADPGWRGVAVDRGLKVGLVGIAMMWCELVDE